MEKVKKYAGYVLFWVIFVFVLSVLSGIFTPKHNSILAGVSERDWKLMGAIAEERDRVDVLILGDSIVLTGVSPLDIWNQQGITSYVAGQSGQKVVESYYWLEEIYPKQTPELVILEVNTLYNGEGAVAEMDYSLGELVEHYIPLAHYHDRWKNLTKADLTEEPVYTEIDVTKGFKVKTGTDPYPGGDYMEDNEMSGEIDPATELYLKKLTSFCQSRGIELLLLSVPSPQSWNNERHDAVAEYADAHGLPYLDLNQMTEEVGIDWSKDTMDAGLHLNYTGSMKVSEYLGNYIAEQYPLTDHRGDQVYWAWDENYKQYQMRLPQEIKTEK